MIARDDLWSITHAAALLDYSRSRVNRILRRGLVAPYRITGRR
jgi:hypothetical protein